MRFQSSLLKPSILLPPQPPTNGTITVRANAEPFKTLPLENILSSSLLRVPARKTTPDGADAPAPLLSAEFVAQFRVLENCILGRSSQRHS
jgi:hypothetical protein